MIDIVSFVLFATISVFYFACIFRLRTGFLLYIGKEKELFREGVFV